MSNLLIFVVGLAIMLLCMMRTKWGPFVCMLLASLAIGIGCGLGTDKTIASIVDGFAKTCKNIGLMVIFGTILGIYLFSVMLPLYFCPHLLSQLHGKVERTLVPWA